MNDLIETIENLCEILLFLAVNEELTDTQAMLYSQEINKLLVQYQKKINM